MHIVKQSFAGLGVTRPAEGSPAQDKNPISAFMKVVATKVASGNEIEQQKLQLEREQFEHKKSVEAAQVIY